MFEMARGPTWGGGVLPKLGGVGGFASTHFYQLMRVCVPCDYVRASFFQRFTHGGLALQHILHDQLWVTQLWKDSISCLVTACGL